jgi:hypothetical protein
METRSNTSTTLPPTGRRDQRRDCVGDLGQVALVPLLRELPADLFVLNLKTKGFHWHVGGRYFRRRGRSGPPEIP